MEVQPQYQPNEDYEANCRASIKRIEYILEKVQEMAISDKPLSAKDQLFIDECQRKLQEVNDLAKF